MLYQVQRKRAWQALFHTLPGEPIPRTIGLLTFLKYNTTTAGKDVIATNSVTLSNGTQYRLQPVLEVK